jgi:cobalt-zinc-cadmium efflux system outer membrane protein
MRCSILCKTALFSSLLLPATIVAQEAAPATVTLRSLLDSVLTHNPTVRSAESRAAAARGNRNAAAAFSNPIISFDVENTRMAGLLPSSTVTERETMAAATLPLEQFYHRGARINRADAEMRAAEARHRITRQKVLLNASTAFYGTALAQVRVASINALIVWLDSVVTYNAARVQEGAAAEVDLLRAQLERDRTLAELALAESDLARSRASLVAHFIAGVNAAASLLVQPDTTPFPLSATTNDIDAAVSRALANRPELVAFRELQNAARSGISVERSNLFREIGATFGVKRTEFGSSVMAGVSASVPLFDRNRGQLTRARAESEATAFDVAQMELEVRSEVTAALQAARILTDRVNAFSTGSSTFLSRADETRRISFSAYQEGAVPLTQVIDAARIWSEARVLYFEVLFAQHQSVVALLAAQGNDLMAGVPLRD